MPHDLSELRSDLFCYVYRTMRLEESQGSNQEKTQNDSGSWTYLTQARLICINSIRAYTHRISVKKSSSGILLRKKKKAGAGLVGQRIPSREGANGG